MNYEKLHENLILELKENTEYNELNKRHSQVWCNLMKCIPDDAKMFLNELDSINNYITSIELKKMYDTATNC